MYHHDTDVPTTPRKAMSPMRRLRVFEAHRGVCILCKTKIDGVREPWTVEHVRALGLGGEDDDSNCGPAHMSSLRKSGRAMSAFGANDAGRCNFISNGADRADLAVLFKEMAARFSGMPEVKGGRA